MSSATGAGSYRAVLRLPHAAPTFGAALVGRLSFGLLPLSVLFTVQQATSSFALAGSVLGVLGLTSLLLPLKARLVDRLGQPRVLGGLAVACSAALVVVAGLAGQASTPRAAYVVVGVVAGLAAPPLGPSMRATWAVLTEDSPLRPRAYALDAICEEALYLVGPLIVGVVVTVASARAALLLTAVTLLAGTVVMVAMPPSRRRRQRAPSSGKRSTPRGGTGPLRAPGLPAVLLTMLGVGAGLSAVLVGIAARAQDAGSPAASGYVEAAVAAGSVVGGLVWGQRRHSRSHPVQLAGLCALLAAGVALAAAVSSLVATGVVMALAGLAIAPLFVVAYLAADALVSPDQRTEAGTWVNTAYNVGTFLGAAGAGAVTDVGGAATGLLCGAAVLAVMSGVTVVGAGGVRRGVDFRTRVR